jgi:hypothetical protein
MKRTILGLVAIASILLISSCGQTNQSNPIGVWVFKSNSYYPSKCAQDSSKLVAPSGSSTITLAFAPNAQGTLPGSSNTFTVVDTTPVSGTQVYILVNTGTAQYRPKAGGQVAVTVSPLNNWLSVSGSGIELINMGSATDSTAVSFTLNQNQ